MEKPSKPHYEDITPPPSQVSEHNGKVDNKVDEEHKNIHKKKKQKKFWQLLFYFFVADSPKRE